MRQSRLISLAEAVKPFAVGSAGGIAMPSSRWYS